MGRTASCPADPVGESSAGVTAPDPDDDGAASRPERIGAAAYRALYLQCPDGVFFTIPDGQVIAANPAACDMLRLTEEEICRRGRQGLADPSDHRWGRLVSERDRTGTVHGVARMLRGDGVAIEVDISAQVFREGETLRTCTVIRDVTERVAIERDMAEMAARLREMALFDELTGLRNRRGFADVAGQVLEVADRQGLACHVLFLDVDNMKELNDTLGHSAGDAGLRAVATTLKHVLRRSDVAARLSGDEFVVLSVGMDDDQRVGLEQRIRSELASLRTTRAVGRAVGVSIGWAARPPGSDLALEELMVRADQVMYRDKKLRSGR